ncbi:MAG: agmatine deiminase family protein, partial [Planctomycetota bacterium]
MKRRDFLKLTGISAAKMTSGASLTNADINRKSEMPDYKSTGVKLIANSTPTSDGFYFPAEWEKHESTIMAFPPPQNWKALEISLKDVYQQWADVANTISEYEPVLMAVRPQEKRIAKRILSEEIELFEVPLNDGWSRDTGPIFLVNDKGDRRVAGFTFNGWGAKFPPYRDDALLKARLCKHLDAAMYPIDAVLEGGAVAVDGEGTLITTEQCLLNMNRNAASKAELEKLLNQSFGTEKVIWLGKGLQPDPITDGHVDGILAYASPGVVLLHTTDERDDPNYKICRDAKRRLKEARDAKGRKLEVIELPLTSEELCHMNFYIGNGCVVVPTTGTRRVDAEPMSI